MYIDHCRLIVCHNSFELYSEEELILSRAVVSMWYDVYFNPIPWHGINIKIPIIIIIIINKLIIIRY